MRPRQFSTWRPEHEFGTPIFNRSAETTLKSAITSSFTARRSIDKSIAFPIIIERYERAPDIWQGLLERVLSASSDLPSSIVALVRPLLEHKEPDLRAAAFEAIYKSDPADKAELLSAALRDSDPDLVRKGLALVDVNESQMRGGGNGAEYEFPIDAFSELVMKSGAKQVSNEIREEVRSLLASDDLTPQSIDQLLARLTAILDDPARKDEHLPAIRIMRSDRRRPSHRQPEFDSG